MTLAEAIGVLRRLWYVVLAFAILGVGAGAVIFSGQTTTYRSSVDLVLTPEVVSSDTKDVSNALVALDRRTLIGTLAVVAGSGQIRTASLTATGVPDSDITAFGGTAVAEANVVTVSVTGASAAAVEAVTAEAVTEIVDRFEGQYPLYRVEPIDEPVASVVRGAPVWQLIGVGLVAGTLIGVLVALFVDAAQRSRLDRDPTVPMGYVAVPVEFIQATRQPAASVSAPVPTVPPAVGPGPETESETEPPAVELDDDLDLDLDLVLDLEAEGPGEQLPKRVAAESTPTGGAGSDPLDDDARAGRARTGSGTRA